MKNFKEFLFESPAWTRKEGQNQTKQTKARIKIIQAP